MADNGKSDGRYRRIDEIGEGGFGRVTRCFDRRLRRMVARKEPIRAGDESREQLIHEARLLAYLDHPGVVAVYNSEEEDTDSAYTMKVLSGESLLDRIERLRAAGEQMSIFDAVRIVSRVAETMASAHDKGVLHMDLKPANVMLEDYGQVSVIDWGAARFYDTDRYAAYLSAGGEQSERFAPKRVTVPGTPAYMPVEQLVPGEDAFGPSADVFAVGTMLYELLTGELPFPAGGNPMTLAYTKASSQPRPLYLQRADVSDQLGELCLSMLRPEPQQRPGSFHEVLAELAALSDFGQAAESVWLRPGEVLFAEGDEGTTAFQILEGELVISVADGDETRIIATRQVGDVIGELAMLSQTRRSATVTAKSSAHVRCIDWHALEVELRKANPLLDRMMRSLSDRLIEATKLGS